MTEPTYGIHPRAEVPHAIVQVHDESNSLVPLESSIPTSTDAWDFCLFAGVDENGGVLWEPIWCSQKGATKLNFLCSSTGKKRPMDSDTAVFPRVAGQNQIHFVQHTDLPSIELVSCVWGCILFCSHAQSRDAYLMDLHVDDVDSNDHIHQKPTTTFR